MRNYAKERELPRSGLVQHIVEGYLPYNPSICVLGVQTACIIFKILRIEGKLLDKNVHFAFYFFGGGWSLKMQPPFRFVFLYQKS
jgi:hypothetical protein